MLKKKQPPPRVAPLQYIVGQVVTDPAEIAAMDKIRKRRTKKTRREGGKRASE